MTLNDACGISQVHCEPISWSCWTQVDTFLVYWQEQNANITIKEIVLSSTKKEHNSSMQKCGPGSLFFSNFTRILPANFSWKKIFSCNIFGRFTGKI
jgi:hypothetical protein